MLSCNVAMTHRSQIHGLAIDAQPIVAEAEATHAPHPVRPPQSDDERANDTVEAWAQPATRLADWGERREISQGRPADTTMPTVKSGDAASKKSLACGPARSSSALGRASPPARAESSEWMPGPTKGTWALQGDGCKAAPNVRTSHVSMRPPSSAIAQLWHCRARFFCLTRVIFAHTMESDTDFELSEGSSQVELHISCTYVCWPGRVCGRVCGAATRSAQWPLAGSWACACTAGVEFFFLGFFVAGAS